MSSPTEAGPLLHELAVLKRPCDLDLLMFFARHPRTLLSSDQIAAFLGYAVKDVATSLELLLESGLVTRTPTRRQVARMYVLADGRPVDGVALALTRLAATRGGRLALLVELQHRSPAAQSEGTRPGDTRTGAPPPLRFPQGRAVGGDLPRQDAVDVTGDCGEAGQAETGEATHDG